VLLAIDTSVGSAVAVVDDGAVIAERADPGTRGHAETIGVLIARCLAHAGATPADLSAVAVGTGPGPFTGLRVGIAAARAFAFGIGRPVLPVVSHDAIAFGRPGAFVVTTDARRREVAWSRYAPAGADGLPVRVSGPDLAPADGAADALAVDGLEVIAADRVPAGALGLLAGSRRARGLPHADDAPLYLRAPDVTMSATNASGPRVTR